MEKRKDCKWKKGGGIQFKVIGTTSDEAATRNKRKLLGTLL